MPPRKNETAAGNRTNSFEAKYISYFRGNISLWLMYPSWKFCGKVSRSKFEEKKKKEREEGRKNKIGK